MTPHPPARIATLQSGMLAPLQEQIAQFSARGEVVHALMQGESDLPTPPHIVEAGMRALREGHTRYPPGRGYAELRRQVNRELLIRMLVLSIQGIIRPETVEELHLRPREALEHILAILFDGILTPTGRRARRVFPGK